MTPLERQRWRTMLKISRYGGSGLEKEVHRLINPINCLHCNRPIETIRQRVWHWFVCWKKQHPMQATKRGRTEEDV